MILWLLHVLLCSEQIIQMDNDSCVLKYIEIVPLDNSPQEFEDIKPFEVKICAITNLIAWLTNVRLKNVGPIEYMRKLVWIY